MAQIFINNAYGVLASSLGTSAGNKILSPGHSFVDPGPNNYYRATLVGLTNGVETSWEIVRVKSVVGNELFIEVRGLEDTTPIDWPAGTRIEARLTAEQATAFEASKDYGDHNVAGYLKGFAGQDLLRIQNQDYTLAFNFTAAAGRSYYVGGGRTVTLPYQPTRGDQIELTDTTNAWENNPITLLRNGENIMGEADDMRIGIENFSGVFKYLDATRGWWWMQ